MAISTNYDYIMWTKLKFKWEKLGSQNYAATEDPSSSSEGPPVAHRLSFSPKKEKRRKCKIHDSNQS